MWIEFLKTGGHTDTKGRKHEFPPERLDDIANVNNALLTSELNYSIPLTKGHKFSGEPASGWIKEIKRKGSRLIARLDEVPKEVMKQIASGGFRNVSVSLDGDKIRHIALLGTENPSVNGLDPFKYIDKSDFQAAESDVADINTEPEIEYKPLYDEIDKLKFENKNYLNQLFELEREKRLNGFKEYLVYLHNTGIMEAPSPDDIDSAVDLLEAAYIYDKNSGRDGEMLEKMKSFICNSKPKVSLTEFAVKPSQRNIISSFESKNVDPARLRRHLDTLDYMQNNPDLSYEQALSNIY